MIENQTGVRRITIRVQIDEQDILRYIYTSHVDFIPYDVLEELQADIEKFILYTLTNKRKGEQEG